MVSVLFNEPKLLKYMLLSPQHSYKIIRFSALQRAEIAEIVVVYERNRYILSFSALQRAEIAEIEATYAYIHVFPACFSALQRAEIAEIRGTQTVFYRAEDVSVLFNEPKLLKFCHPRCIASTTSGFSALQRAEIAEMEGYIAEATAWGSFSALQRAEIAEIFRDVAKKCPWICFSALQRAEIAEMYSETRRSLTSRAVSVLFNEPKLLKFFCQTICFISRSGFSALQRAEIAEMQGDPPAAAAGREFQCSSTSRNC